MAVTAARVARCGVANMRLPNSNVLRQRRSYREEAEMSRARRWIQFNSPGHGGARVGAGRKPLPEEERRIACTYRLPRNLVEQVEACAGRNYMSKNDLVCLALEAWITEH